MWREAGDQLRHLVRQLGRHLPGIAKRTRGRGSEQPPATGGRSAASEATFSPAPADELRLHLGIDFGTQFTKVCFRDLGRERSEVITFAPLGRASLEEALLPSYVEIHAGVVHAGLTESEWKARGTLSTPGRTVDFLKIRLAQLDPIAAADGWPLSDIGALAAPEMIEALTAYCLARVLTRARQWVAEERSQLLVGRRPIWSASVGVPVEYCDSPALARFERVLWHAAAWAEIGVPAALRLADLLASVRALSGTVDDVECFVLPELAAGVRSFIASPQAPEGAYVHFDIGAGTLDGVAFRYFREQGRPRLVCHSATVFPLGLAAVAKRVSTQAGVRESEVERILLGIEGGTAAPLDGVRRDIWRAVARILREAKERDRSAWSAGIEQLARTRRQDIAHFPFFLGGGGSASVFYREAVRLAHSMHRLADANIRPYRLERVPVPADLDLNGVPREHFHRFAVAYGLSIPPGEAGDLDLPSATPPEGPRPQKPPPTTRYEDTKDLT